MDEEEKNNNEEQTDVNGSNDINSRPLSSGGMKNFFKNPITSIANKLKNGLSSFNKGGTKIGFLFSLKIKIILFVIIVVVVLIAAITLAMGDDTSSSAIESRESGVAALGIDENSSEIDKNALKLYENYDSLIGFNNDQLKIIFDSLINEDSPESQYLVSSANQIIGSGSDKYSVNHESALYDHIQRTEKYNFNNIVWKEYSHQVEGNIINTQEREDLGLKIPEGVDEETLIKLLETTAPYLLTSDIPLGMLCGMIAYSNANEDSASTAEKLTYEIIKEAQTKLTVNKYTLQNIKFNTYYEDYDTINYSGKLNVTYNILNGSVTVNSLPSYQQVGETIDNQPTPEQKVSDDSISEEVYWYVAKAETYDSKITNEFDYEKYSEEDVANFKNPDVSTLISKEDINRTVSGTKISSTNDVPNNWAAFLVKFGLPDGVSTIDTLKADQFGNVYLTYDISYTSEVGTAYTYEKEWKDKCSPKSSESVVYTYDDLKTYNTSESNEDYKNIPTDKIIEDEENFNAENPYKSYEEQDNTVLYGLSLIDFIDSNKGTYLEYIPSENSAYSAHVGLGRGNMQEGYRQIKNILNNLANNIKNNNDDDGTSNNNSSSNKKVLPFVYGSSLGYEISTVNKDMIENNDVVAGYDLLKQYIHALEGNTGEKEENGIRYYKVGLVYENRTVGYGLDLETSGKEQELIDSAKRAGYGDISTEVGSWIPADLVDAITDAVIDERYNMVVAATDGLGLTEYQIHALTSRCYNAGFSGGFEVNSDSNGYSFTSAFKEFWNQEIDDKYPALYEKYGPSEIDSSAESDILSQVDYNNGLYVNYMNSLDSGLTNRRNSEWILFQTGYYGYNTNVKRLYGAGAGLILECAENIHKYMEDNNYTYCVYGGNRYEECGTYGKSHGLDATFEESKTGHHNTCCATFVSWVLQEAGYITRDEHIEYGCNGTGGLTRLLKAKGFTRVELSELEAGDIIIYDGHVEIYAGDNTKYNAGSGEAIRRDSPYNFGNPVNCGAEYGLRAPN